MSHPTQQAEPVQGIGRPFTPHPRIAEIIKVCKSINLRCVPWKPTAVAIGTWPDVVDIQVEVLELPHDLHLDLYHCFVWRTKERFCHVALGAGFLFSKLSMRGISLHGKT